MHLASCSYVGLLVLIFSLLVYVYLFIYESKLSHDIMNILPERMSSFRSLAASGNEVQSASPPRCRLAIIGDMDKSILLEQNTQNSNATTPEVIRSLLLLDKKHNDSHCIDYYTLVYTSTSNDELVHSICQHPGGYRSMLVSARFDNWLAVDLLSKLAAASTTTSNACVDSIYLQVPPNSVEPHPPLSRLGLVRQLARHSTRLVAWHREDALVLIHAYGVRPSKMLVFKNSSEHKQTAEQQAIDLKRALLGEGKQAYANFDTLTNAQVMDDLNSTEANRQVVACWTNRRYFGYNHAKFSLEGFRMHMHVLYADHNVQLNVRVNKKRRLTTAALRVGQRYVLVDLEAGVDSLDMRTDGEADDDDELESMSVDYVSELVRVRTVNVHFVVVRRTHAGGEVRVEFLRWSQWAHAYGMIGETSRPAASSDELSDQKVAELDHADDDNDNDSDDADSGNDDDDADKQRKKKNKKKKKAQKAKQKLKHKWQIADKRDLFSHYALGQMWRSSGGGAGKRTLASNAFELEENHVQTLTSQSTQGNASKTTTQVNFHIHDYQVYASTGFGAVNRALFLELHKRQYATTNNNATASRISVFLRKNKLQGSEMQADEKSIDILVAYSLWRRQETYAPQSAEWSILSALSGNEEKRQELNINFVHAFPPLIDTNKKKGRRGKKQEKEVQEPNSVNIVMTPWETVAFPLDWVKLYNSVESKVVDVWTPSTFNHDGLMLSGVQLEKLHVIPYGLNYERYQRDVQPLELATRKSFKFFTNAGVTPRKGLDILLKAYTSVFRSTDDVTLVIQSIYSFHASDQFILDAKNAPDAPEIVYMTRKLSDMELIRLYKSVDVYILPFRAEGFGITMVEAMAAGLPIIVTGYGPPLDFASNDTAMFIDATEVECTVDPCGQKMFLKYKLPFQSKWSEPNVQSLAKLMTRAHRYREKTRQMAVRARQAALKYSWSNITDLVEQRLRRIASDYFLN